MSENARTLPIWTQRTVHRSAVFSSDGNYRYQLMRWWQLDKVLPFIMLNPSTADGDADDPTVRRCMGFAHRFGFTGIVVVNIFAFVDRMPTSMMRVPDPFGPDNEIWLSNVATYARSVTAPLVCAWGPYAKLRDGHARTLDILRRNAAPLYCLGTTQAGYPRHPLMLHSDTQLEPFDGRRRH